MDSKLKLIWEPDSSKKLDMLLKISVTKNDLDFEIDTTLWKYILYKDPKNIKSYDLEFHQSHKYKNWHRFPVTQNGMY